MSYADAQSTDWIVPPRFGRPDISSDEGGLWAEFDHLEQQLRRSPFRIKNKELESYIQSIACKLGEEHCPDIRVYLIETPMFNANMAPNGMMQVWSGLLLRADNEAQLAAVLGHEIGHYMAKHGIANLRDTKSKSAFAQFLGAFGLVGAIGQLAVLASAFAYSRDQERMADSIGAQLMTKAGYNPSQAAVIWQNLLVELQANPAGDPTKSNVLFATHPPPEERQAALTRFAEAHPGGELNTQEFNEKTAPFRKEWLAEEAKRGQFEESIALLTRKIAANPAVGDYLFTRAEVYRMRAKDTDIDAALKDYLSALASGNGPPETFRGLGMIYRSRNDMVHAKENFGKYIEFAPDSPDLLMIKSYMENMSS